MGADGAGVAVKGKGDFFEDVFEDLALHTADAFAADFFFVGEDGHEGVFGVFAVEDGGYSGVGADAVVVTVGAYERAVEAYVAGFCCGDGAEFGIYEVSFGAAVFFIEGGEDVQLYGVGEFFVGLVGFGSGEDVELFAFDYFRGGFFVNAS